jgi:quercetin dioxygenase-like cupin family protein
VNESRPVNRKTLMTAFVEPVAAVSQVRAAQIELTPGQHAGRHTHPCHVVGHVVAGEIRYQLDGEAATTLCPGDAFYEPAGATVVHFDNLSDDEPATFVAFYLLPEGDDRLIVMLDEAAT